MAIDRLAMCSALILLAILNHGSGQEDIDTIFGLVRNLATLGNTELNYISDFASPAQTQLLDYLNENSIPANIYNVGGLRERQKLFENEACPLFSGDGCQGEGCAGDKIKRCKRGDDASCEKDDKQEDDKHRR